VKRGTASAILRESMADMGNAKKSLWSKIFGD
jgi:hypothetical protein